MQGLADGYFVLPYTIGDYLSKDISTGPIPNDSKEFLSAEKEVKEKIEYLRLRDIPESNLTRKVEDINQIIKRLKERFLRELKVQEIEDLKSNPELKDKIVENSLDSNENLRKVFTGKNN